MAFRTWTADQEGLTSEQQRREAQREAAAYRAELDARKALQGAR